MGSTGTSSISAGLASTSGWDYREFKEGVDATEISFNNLKRDINKFSTSGVQRRVASILRQIDSHERIINAEFDANKAGTGDRGDERVLMTFRRRVRQLRKQVMDFGKNNL